MKVVSTTITNSREDVIGAALSAIKDEVDECHVIDTGATDRTMGIAREVLGDKLVEHQFQWTGSFSDARNFALKCAEEAGADWAVQVDTDDCLTVPALREFLEKRVPADVNAVMIPHVSKTFGHPRCLRTGRGMVWTMPVHEYVNYAKYVDAPQEWYWQCQDRPTENVREKYHSYRRILIEWTEQNPTDGRGWYYLGDTYSILADSDASVPREQNLEKSMGCFRNCAQHSEWKEQAAWACFRLAKILGNLDRLVECERACVEGITKRPDMAELYWAAGVARFHMGVQSALATEKERHFLSALQWAETCVKIGKRPRVAFRYPPAWYELPWQLKAQIMVALRRQEEALVAVEYFKEAYKTRTGHDFVPGTQVME